MFKYSDISFTSDKELNMLMHGTLFCVIVYRSLTLLNIVPCFANPAHTCCGHMCAAD